jgi:DNA-nicking Smr family endonuclease
MGEEEDEPFDPNNPFGDASTELPIDGTLDLHTFRIQEIPDLIHDYLDECQRRGVREIRIVHGRGKGTLRRIVQGELKKRTDLLENRLAPRERGGWGATLVTLRKRDPDAG